MTEKPQTTLKPCPWCGGTNLVLSERAQECLMIVCNNNSCRAEGPWAKEMEQDDHGAAEAWNARIPKGSIAEET